MAVPRAGVQSLHVVSPPPLPRILLIGDASGERYAHSLQRDGFCTLQARTAAEACRLAAELPLAAVVTDIALPCGESGLRLARLLKQDERLRRVPIVVLTGDVFTNDREAAARAGCDRFVPRSFVPDALSRVVAGLINRQP